jgi:hypothetical protein
MFCAIVMLYLTTDSVAEYGTPFDISCRGGRGAAAQS